MRLRLTLGAMALAILVGAEAAVAQTLAVQTGEHDGFTRIVIRIGEDRQWQLDRSDGAARLSVTPAIDGFDLSGSFDLIQRTRISDLRSEDGALSIRLACPCPVSSFRYLERFLVIDVSDAPDGAAPPPSADPLAAGSTNGDGIDARRARERAAAAAALPDLASLLTGGATVLSRRDSEDPARTDPQPPQDPPPPVAAVGTDLEEAARIMAEQLARAAAAGLLSAAADAPVAFADPLAAASAPRGDGQPDPGPTGVPESDGLPVDPPAVSSLAPTLRAPEVAPAPVQQGPGLATSAATGTAFRTAPELPLRALTALDLAVGTRPDPATPTPPLSCTGEALGMDEWSASDDFASGLGALRLDLFDDRDHVVEAATLDLIRHYLSHGFGAEARFWLDRIGAPPPELLSLAALVEGRPEATYRNVLDAAACSDEEFLLRYLGGATRTPLTEGQTNRAQRGFSILPRPLQDLFGPNLARLLAADGHAAPARNIRDALHRSGRVPQASLLALDLDIGIEMETDIARQALDVALRDDGAAPAATMIHALALDRAEGRRTEAARVTAAEALLRETPPGADADSLWREIVAAQARLGRIDGTISMLEAGRDTRPGVWQAAVTDTLADRLQHDDGAALLLMAHLFGPDWTAAGSQAGRIRMATARRLQASGLEAAAQRILDNGPGLILPQTAAAATPSGRQDTLWARADWTDVARGLSGPHGDLASRMARREATPDQTPSRDEGIDLDTLAAQVADSAALRSTVSAVLATPLAAQAP